MSIHAGNPMTPNDYDASCPDPRISVLVTVGVVVIALVLPICLMKFRNNQPQRDIERVKRKLKEAIDLRILNKAIPSKRYEQIRGFKREAAVASTKSSAVEVWYVPSGTVFLITLTLLWCNLPRSPGGCGQRPTIEMRTSASHDLHRLLAQKPPCRLPIMQANICSNRDVTGRAVMTSGKMPSSAATFLWSPLSSTDSTTSIGFTLPRGSL
ncbi:uncharacterized protein B0I36DRAFT_2693 [Microdochium trichocladiopsis]|uniref:Uncharacterized protein n=1 Tax=Microdochium trichocladiopsis TaxID=1682393 RepID=A0A9P9BVR1_9PEZI|nr:uncharacterized protein B0I36DRAFT_2693 [Microdochium trichocladiopsis]KAH7039825.1 hypothetical protein B0I36DRAFT_2693 [Microdochium trichocladiopsis]